MAHSHRQRFHPVPLAAWSCPGTAMHETVCVMLTFTTVARWHLLALMQFYVYDDTYTARVCEGDHDSPQLGGQARNDTPRTPTPEVR